MSVTPPLLVAVLATLRCLFLSSSLRTFQCEEQTGAALFACGDPLCLLGLTHFVPEPFKQPDPSETPAIYD